MQCVFYLPLICAAFVCVNSQCQNPYPPSPPKKAIVRLLGSTVNGNITFTQKNPRSLVQIEGTILQLPIGQHGFHVHAKGDITGGCASTGPHYNPLNVTHGAPSDKIRHIGDLGNIVSTDNSSTNVNFTDKKITLFGDYSIIGRAVVVHAGVDDLGKTDHADSKTTGNAGARVACGVIGII